MSYKLIEVDVNERGSEDCWTVPLLAVPRVGEKIAMFHAGTYTVEDVIHSAGRVVVHVVRNFQG